MPRAFRHAGSPGCAVAAPLRLIDGTLRFDARRRRLTSAMRRRRTHQVRALDASRLITRTIRAQVSPKQEYSLNAHDRSLETVIDALKVRVDLYAEAPVPTHTAA